MKHFHSRAPQGHSRAAELLRQIAEQDPEGHARALAAGYGAGPMVACEAWVLEHEDRNDELLLIDVYGRTVNVELTRQAKADLRQQLGLDQ